MRRWRAWRDRFAAMSLDLGRPSIPPEQLLRALLLQYLYSVRWFVGLGMDEPIWDHSSFSKNRDRLLAGEIATAFLRRC